MTPEEIAEIRAREQAATPGPWTWSAGMIEAPPGVDGGMEAVLWTANISGEHDDDDYQAALGACGIHAEEHAADNLRFLAHAREDVPKLLAHVADLEAQLEEITDLDRSALKHQELKDERARAVRMWHDEKKRADQAEARVAELDAELKLARSHRIASPSKAVDPTVHTPERIAAYLIARGWRPRPGSRNLWDLRDEETVHVHHAATASDYLGRTGLLVSDLASAYGQGELQVLADIAEAGDE